MAYGSEQYAIGDKRDAHIGWSSQARAVNRELVVANSRFLLLPWVQVRDLASHVLAMAARQLAHDWQSACGLQPVLLETYVDASRYRATCYRAAGWKHVGSTSARTRNDRTRQGRVRDIYLLPLSGDYLRRLCSEPIVRKPRDPSGTRDVEFSQTLRPAIPLVFHNNGRTIVNYYKAWRRACQAAGLSGKIPYDFRRTAVRNMVRVGIPEKVAMQMAGHKTRSVFDRYHIVSVGDLRDAARRLEAAFPQSVATFLATVSPLMPCEAVVSSRNS